MLAEDRGKKNRARRPENRVRPNFRFGGIFGTAPAEYLASQDLIAQWLDECCVSGAGLSAPRTTLFASWKSWAEAAGEPPGKMAEFYEVLGRDFQPARETAHATYAVRAKTPPVNRQENRSRPTATLNLSATNGHEPPRRGQLDGRCIGDSVVRDHGSERGIGVASRPSPTPRSAAR
jgi:hypothetical protein